MDTYQWLISETTKLVERLKLPIPMSEKMQILAQINELTGRIKHYMREIQAKDERSDWGQDED